MRPAKAKTEKADFSLFPSILLTRENKQDRTIVAMYFVPAGRSSTSMPGEEK